MSNKYATTITFLCALPALETICRADHDALFTTTIGDWALLCKLTFEKWMVDLHVAHKLPSDLSHLFNSSSSSQVCSGGKWQLQCLLYSTGTVWQTNSYHTSEARIECMSLLVIKILQFPLTTCRWWQEIESLELLTKIWEECSGEPCPWKIATLYVILGMWNEQKMQVRSAETSPRYK